MNTELLLWPFLQCHRQRLLLCLLAFVLAACDSEQATSNLAIDADQISLELPDRIRQVQALDPDKVEAIATVNGLEYTLERVGEQFRAAIQVETNSPASISLLFRERLDNGGVLNLASHTSTLQIANANQTLQLFNDDFNDSQFDDDGDQISNLIEREEDTDPFVFDTRPENRNININFALPRIINEPQITQVIATIAGTPRAVRRDGNDFEISGVATTRSSVSVEVILLQRLASGQTLVLADATRPIAPGVQSVSILLTDNDFDFNKDQDGDGRTNLQELQGGTDPFSPD